MPTPQDYLAVAFEALDAIRPILKKNFGKPERVERKPDGTLVTNVDSEVETMVRDIIKKHFPTHGILGEELAPENPDSEFQWIIDPIDGTLHFIHGVPVYGAIIALYQNGTPLLGTIDVPETGSRYHAVKGAGAFLNGTPMHIADCAETEVLDGLLGVSSRYGFVKSDTSEAYDKLCQTHTGALMVPNCYGHGLAASGAVTAMVNFHLSLWDIASTKILIEEAGGKFAVRKRGDLYDIICGKPTVVNWLLKHFEMEDTGLDAL